MSVGLYREYLRTLKTLPSTGRIMPYRWGLLPDPLGVMWMPYSFMFEEFARELANAINAFTQNVDRLAAWAVVAAPVSDMRKLNIAHEFVDVLATNAVNAPYVLRSRIIFATAHLSHQANRAKVAGWIDDLPLDGQIYLSAADKNGKSWQAYKSLKLCIEAIAGSDMRAATHDFRNSYNHRFSPRFMIGETSFVAREIDPTTKTVSYAFGGTPALQLTDVVSVLNSQRDRIYSAFDAFQALVREQEDAIRSC